jgi:hypothetical protein
MRKFCLIKRWLSLILVNYTKMDPREAQKKIYCSIVPQDIYFLKLYQEPPLKTSSKPFDFRILLAEALLAPEAQQVIIGLFLLSFLIFFGKLSIGIFMEFRR